MALQTPPARDSYQRQWKATYTRSVPRAALHTGERWGPGVWNQRERTAAGAAKGTP